MAGWLHTAARRARRSVIAGRFVWRLDYLLSRLFMPLAVGLLIWGGLGWVKQALNHAIERPLPALAVEDLSGKPISLTSNHLGIDQAV